MKPRRILLLLIHLLTWSHLALGAKRRPVYNNSQNKRSTQIEHEHYIKTSECHIPYIPKQDQRIKELTEEVGNDGSCSKGDTLISSRFDEKLQQYVLHVNDSVAQSILRTMEEESPNLVGYNCSYREIKRVHNNSTAVSPVFLGREVTFWDGYIVPRNVEGLKATCRNELAEDLQSDTFAFVQPQKTDSPLISWHRRPNVIMIGLDGISQSNFHRNMPKIFNHLRMQGWFAMKGYSRVGNNTLHNLMALLAGYSPNTWMNLKCDASKVGCMKSIPLIWKRFKRKGYITAYGEGMSKLSIFSLDKLGFFENPTDFYARPFLELKKKQECIDRRLNIKYIYDYCEQYLKRHANSSRPLFGLFFGQSISHDKSYANDKMRVELLEKLMKLKKMGTLSESIVVLLSDQGPLRKGESKDFLEESMPILFIWLPTWFRALHPEIVQALRINSKRLTSPYDLHLTLQHILELGERWPRAVDKLVDCPTCQTLFAPVPENRTCSDAGISEAYCPCDSYKLLQTKQIKQMSLGKLLIRSINNFLHNHNLQELCSNLTLQSVTMVQQRRDRKPSSGGTYRVDFTAIPNNSTFSATTRYNHRHQILEYINVESINRLNSYRSDSDCMRRLKGRKFCICMSRIVMDEPNESVKEAQAQKKKVESEIPNQEPKKDSELKKVSKRQMIKRKQKIVCLNIQT
uniref:Uncharacterized protein LOC108040774 isoform X1 n=1 Tax=Drosophila rhopaloa TaxID=1041015 RepID=A0A6P4EBC2_DRORH